MKGTTFKRCGCRDPHTKQRLGQKCPQLRTAGGRWSRSHGAWYWQIELPARADGRRRPLRHGTYPTQAAAETVLDAITAAFTLPDRDDTQARSRLADLIEDLVKHDAPIPDPTSLRRLLQLEVTPSQLPTVAAYVERWLAGRKNIKAGTRRAYEAHIRLHLIPHLGDLRIDRLRATHIAAMFDAIEQSNRCIARARDSGDRAMRATAHGRRTVGAATQHRIRATLRKALNDAIRRDKLITTNEATLVELPGTRRPKAMVWTDERISRWRDTDELPSAVMVWTPTQTGAFLDHAHRVSDRLYPLYHLIAFSGLRRGEACAVHWDDLDLDNKTLTVRWQLVQHGWATTLDTPKTDDSDAVIALDTTTIAVLRARRTNQRRERLAAGSDWTPNRLVFTTSDGRPLHPADVTDHFHDLAAQAGLPPIRLHDLRHGAATLALAAGVDMKVISAQLRHSDPHFTAATYAHILPELAHSAAEATAAMIPLRHTRTVA